MLIFLIFIRKFRDFSAPAFDWDFRMHSSRSGLVFLPENEQRGLVFSNRCARLCFGRMAEVGRIYMKVINMVVLDQGHSRMYGLLIIRV